MMILIIGGSGSGKSEYAENLLGSLAEGRNKYYIATMMAFGEEGKKRVERHRKLRAGKGFETIEQPVNIEEILEKIADCQEGVKLSESDVVQKHDVNILLECMSNLVANEMFAEGADTSEEDEASETSPRSAEAVVKKILTGMDLIQSRVKNLVVVSNNIFEDGVIYDETTTEYLEALGRINSALCEQADRAYEIVSGIPMELRR